MLPEIYNIYKRQCNVCNNVTTIVKLPMVKTGTYQSVIIGLLVLSFALFLEIVHLKTH